MVTSIVTLLHCVCVHTRVNACTGVCPSLCTTLSASLERCLSLRCPPLSDALSAALQSPGETASAEVVLCHARA